MIKKLATKKEMDNILNKNFPLFLTAWIIFPLYIELPTWTLVLAIYILLATFLKKNLQLNFLPDLIKKIITIGGLIAIWINYKTLLGSEPAVNFITLLACLKVFEAKNIRDYKVHSYLLIILLLGVAITLQSLMILFHIGISFIFITSLLYHYSKGGKETFNLKDALQRILKFQIIVLPLVILIFFLFPRYSGRMISLPRMTNVDQIGFTDRLNPGSMGNLLSDNTPVMRVKIEKNGKVYRLDNSQLYWRGATLSYTNGISWSPHTLDINQHQHQSNKSEELDLPINDEIIQEIVLEAKNHAYLFALDAPKEIFARSNRNIRLIKEKNKTYRTDKIIRMRSGYKAKSVLVVTEKIDLLKDDLTDYTFAPKRPYHGQFLNWVQEIKQKSVNDKDFSLRVLDYFKKNMTYSLKSDEYTSEESRDFLNTLLFKKKTGLCAHFASAYALIMRFKQIPARVVVGYQGGEYNQFGEYLLVREKDAHAWVEIYQDGLWERIDPTYVINPARITKGEGVNRKEFLFQNFFLYQKYLEYALIFDGVNNRLNQFLLNYDFQYQKDVLEKLLGLKLSFFLMFGYLLIFIFIFIFLILAFKVMMERKKSLDKNEKLVTEYIRFVKKIKKMGIEKQNFDGPMDFLLKIKVNLGNDMDNENLRTAIEDILVKYINLRYGKNKVSMIEIKELARKINTI